MRRATFALALGLSFGSYAWPQEPARAGETAQEVEQGDPWIWWKWANFAILAGVLGYLINKNVPPMFRRRSEEIRQAIADGAKAKQDAQAHAAAIEKRLAGIQKEIESLRTTARSEMQAEAERFRRETTRSLERIQYQTTQEMALMTRVSRNELRKYSAELAVDLAEQRIRSRIAQDTQDRLADGFLHDLRDRRVMAR